MKLLSILLIFVGLLVSCEQPKTNPEKEKQTIIKNWTDWGVKANSGDPGYYWTDDVVIMGPEGTIKGKKEFLKMFAGISQNPEFKMIWDKEPSEIQISEDGTMAYLFAKNKIVMPDSTGAVISRTNQALQIWKKDKEGNWKAAVSVMYPDESKK